MNTTLPLSRDTPRHKAHLDRRALRKAFWFYIFTLPWLVGFLTFTVGGLLFGLWVTLTNFDGTMMLSQVKIVGLKNWLKLADDARLIPSFLNTLKFTMILVPVGNLLALLLASLLNQKVRGKNLFRTLFYLPTLLPIIITVIAWKILLNKNSGLLNGFLDILKPGTAIDWLQPDWLPFVLVVMSFWSIGYGVVIYLAGLQQIPQELKEAAMIDGGNAWHVFSHITIPLMTPMIFYQLIVGVIGAMQTFLLPVLVSSGVGGGTMWNRGINLGGMPEKSVYMIFNHAMVQTFTSGNYGYSIVIMWLVSIFLVTLSAILFRTSRHWVFYEVER